ncbi:MAG: hypothetical protein J6A11_10880 [Lachnospiraceae bacterium]|nr:hypothetical protein [Lachnospiraceae bacterium]
MKAKQKKIGLKYFLLVLYIEILTAFRIGFDFNYKINVSYGWAGYRRYLTGIGHIVSIGVTIVIVAFILVPTIYLTMKIINSKQCKGQIFIIWACVILGVIIAVLLNLAGISIIGRMAYSLFEFMNSGIELYYMDWLM